MLILVLERPQKLDLGGYLIGVLLLTWCDSSLEVVLAQVETGNRLRSRSFGLSTVITHEHIQVNNNNYTL